ncbi:MAG TPA: benzoate-CoA ligase family protein [Vicinamibacterales bacterium]|jgi:benzoate-CoA ligase
MSVTAEALGVPDVFNAAEHFVDRNVTGGRASKVAVECGADRLTYADVLHGVNRCGSALRDSVGVRPEERVLLLLLDGPAFVYAFWGAIKIGAVPVPLNTLWKPADYEYVLLDSRATVLIVSEELLPQIERVSPQVRSRLRQVIVTGRPFDALLASGTAELAAEATRRDAPAFWLYSSGSTGKPKACVHLQHDMVVCAELFGKSVLGIAENDRTFSVAKLFFAYGLGNALYFPFAVGATTILTPGQPTAAHVYETIAHHRPTLFYSVPTGFGMMLAQAPPHDAAGAARDFDLSSVRLAVSAGEALPEALYERFKHRFGVDIIDGIGSTEVLHMFISNRPGAIRPGSSGQIVPGYDARIADDDGGDVADGEIGNLWIKGDSVCAGYWNQHEKTKDTIEGHWIRTGDKYSRDADGYYWYAGRADDMLKVGGLWVSPIEVENALMAHAAILECGVIGREDHDRLVKPMAFVVLREGHDASVDLASALQQFVRDRLADYKRPRWVEFVTELPKTATGKIQRYRLRQIAAGQKS